MTDHDLQENLTKRDGEYLRALFLLKGHREPVGPTKLASVFGISKVSSYEKMRRLEILGFGKYILRKGFLMNTKATDLVQSDIHRHHILERYIQLELGLDSRDACRESSNMAHHTSHAMIERIRIQLGTDQNCDCGCCLTPPYDPEDLKDCHWCKPFFQDQEGLEQPETTGSGRMEQIVGE